jgi:hypothetical protein
MMVTGKRGSRSDEISPGAMFLWVQMTEVKGIGSTDRRLTDCVAKCVCQSVQGAPARAMPGDDVFDAKRPQRLHCIWNNAFHYAAQMQTSHDAMYRNIGEQVSHLRAYVGDAGMRAGAEDDQSQMADMNDEHSLIDQERIRLPRGIGARPTQMIDPALFESADPRDLAAVKRNAGPAAAALRGCSPLPRHGSPIPPERGHWPQG